MLRSVFGMWRMWDLSPATILGQRKTHFEGLPGGAVVKNLPANAGDTGPSPGPGRSHMPRSS